MIGAYKEMFLHYFDFKGRSARRDFWLAFLMHFLITFGFGIIFVIMLFKAILDGVSGSFDIFYDSFAGLGIGLIVIGIVYLLYLIATALPFLALQARRFRDAGLPFWAFWGPMIVNIILTIGNGSQDLEAITAITSLISIYTLVVCCLPTKERDELADRSTAAVMANNTYDTTRYVSSQYGGQPQYGQPQGAQNQYGQPQYGQQYGQPQSAQNQYGQQYGQSQNQQSPYTYGMSPAEEDDSQDDDPFDYKNSPYMDPNASYSEKNPFDD